MHLRQPHLTQGPLIDAAALDKAQAHIADALARGARVVAGGTARPGGRFLAPTVLADVTPDMLCAREETFGPVRRRERGRSERERARVEAQTPLLLPSLQPFCFLCDSRISSVCCAPF